MAIVAWGNTVSRLGRKDLLGLQSAVLTAFFGISGLQKPAAAAAAVVIGAIRLHIHKIFFAHHRFNDIPQIFGNRIS